MSRIKIILSSFFIQKQYAIWHRIVLISIYCKSYTYIKQSLTSSLYIKGTQEIVLEETFPNSGQARLVTYRPIVWHAATDCTA